MKICPVCKLRQRRPGKHTCSDVCALIRWRRLKRRQAAWRRRAAPYFAEQAQRLHKED